MPDFHKYPREEDAFALFRTSGRGEPQQAWEIAAVASTARVKMRHTTAETMELSTKNAAKFNNSEPTPIQDWNEQQYRILMSINSQTCTRCMIRSGYAPCSVCLGLGESIEGRRCRACDKGWLPCPACDGTCTIQLASMLRLDDLVHSFQRIFFPKRLLDYAATLTPFYLAQLPTFDIIDENRIPVWLSKWQLDPFALEAQGTPYRVADTATNHTYDGFQCDEAITETKRFVKELEDNPLVVQTQVISFLLPMLLVEYQDTLERSQLVVMTYADGLYGMAV